MVGQKHISGTQTDICLKVSIALCKNIIPEPDQLKSKAYKRVSAELHTLGVSPLYVGQIWRKYKKDTLDTANANLVKSLRHKQGVGPPRRIAIQDLHARVRDIPFHFQNNVRTLAFKIGLP
jgi:hypothetical protein